MPSDRAKKIILDKIENPNLYKGYVVNKLAGDFACEVAKALQAAEQERQEGWRDISEMPSDYDPGEYFLTMIQHWNTNKIKYIVGRMEEDGFYFNDRDKLSHDWNPTLFQPINPPIEDK